jgi:very-short-patch-repair endonuclease
MKRWSEKEDTYLINYYHKTFIDDICKRLNRSRMAIYLRRQRLLKEGKNIRDKKDFFSKYWKSQYRNNDSLIIKHKLAMKKIFRNENIQTFRKARIKEKFNDVNFREKFIKDFINRRNSADFRVKQSRIVSVMMREKHKNPIKHKEMLQNLRKNPSNQQFFIMNLLRKVYGEENVGCNDWKILDGLMEVDIPIYSLKVAIEWDGEYWHSKIKGVKEKDSRKNIELIKRGWKVIRILARSSPPLSHVEIEKHLEKILSAIYSNENLSFIEVK